jgi:succinate dehydrogenase / fumarate reductase, cytochrome b subunit
MSFYQSTVGKKVIMAVSGLIWVGFVIVHMAGNLQVFIGAEKFNAYSRFLHGPGAELLWIVRIVLFVALVLHVLMAWQLTQRAHAARPVDYHRRAPQVSTRASRWMRWGGVFVLLFIVFHLLHFTTRTIDPAGAAGLIDGYGSHDIYGNLVASFRIWWLVLIYIAAMVFLGLHLFHGAWSSVRTLGYAKPSPNPFRRQIALAIALIVWAGFTIIPLGVFAGFIR